MKNLEKEEWKRIYNSKNYFVSNFGRIKRGVHKKWNNKNKAWSTYSEKILKLSNNNSKGYWRINIFYKNNTHKTEAVHRLVALYFKVNPNINDYIQVNHLDGNKNNNHCKNLQWCTNQMNRNHAIKYNLIAKGKLLSNICHFRKLEESEVILIPEMIKTMTLTEIANHFNVGTTTISEIISGRSWNYLNLDFSHYDSHPLNEEQVKSLPKLLQQMSITQAAKVLGVDRTYLGKIRHNKHPKWQYLNLDFSKSFNKKISKEEEISIVKMLTTNSKKEVMKHFNRSLSAIKKIKSKYHNKI